MGSIDFGKVKSIGNVHRDLGDMFYAYPVDFISTEKNICLEEAKGYDYVALEVSGEKLLEVLSDDYKGAENGAKEVKGIFGSLGVVILVYVNKDNIKLWT